MFDVITIGSATRDVFIRSAALETHASAHSPTGVDACLPMGGKVAIDDLVFATGGGATNAAVTFRRLGGLRVGCVCRIGADDSGARGVLEDLHRERVDARFVQRDRTLHTAYSMILLAGSGERTILVYRGASHTIAAREIAWNALQAKWFYVTSLGGDLTLMRRILAHARRTNARVAWNPGSGEIAHGWKRVSPLAAQCAVFNLNKEEAAQLTGFTPQDLPHMLRVLCSAPHAQSGVILITDGSNGAYACADGSAWHIASRNLKTVNTTGAGDAFGSAFVLGLTIENRKSAIENSLRLAMANAEGVITHMGAKAGILSRTPSRAALAKYRVREIPA